MRFCPATLCGNPRHAGNVNTATIRKSAWLVSEPFYRWPSSPPGQEFPGQGPMSLPPCLTPPSALRWPPPQARWLWSRGELVGSIFGDRTEHSGGQAPPCSHVGREVPPHAEMGELSAENQGLPRCWGWGQRDLFPRRLSLAPRRSPQLLLPAPGVEAAPTSQLKLSLLCSVPQKFFQNTQTI